MSSLIFYTDDELALVATDTLATDYGGTPVKLVSKALTVPHLRMIIAGTGVGSFLDEWFLRLNTCMNVFDVENLDLHTPGELQKLWARFAAERRAHGSTTIYHFGIAASGERLRAYVYRSTSGFRSELLPRGIGVKPACTVTADTVVPRDLGEMMTEQQTLQAALPMTKRVYIGGYVVVSELTSQGVFSYIHSLLPGAKAVIDTLFPPLSAPKNAD